MSRMEHYDKDNEQVFTRSARSCCADEGFNRRWLILEYNWPVPPEKIQIDIADRIVSEEREAIVAWAVQALPRLIKKNRYTLPRNPPAGAV